MRKQQGLTPKQRDFVREYLIDKNATQAAIRAGYSEKWADRIGHALVGKNRVKAAIAEEREVLAARQHVSADRVIRELALVAFSNIDNYRTNSSGKLSLIPSAERGAKRAVASLETTVKITDTPRGISEETKTKIQLWNKPQALKMLGEHLGLLKPTDLPALEMLLAALPPDVAATVRDALTKAVQPGGDSGNGSQPNATLEAVDPVP